MTATERITFRLPKTAKAELEQLVEDGEYANVSDAARAAIAELTGTDDRMEPYRSPPLATDGGQEREPVEGAGTAYLCRSCMQLFTRYSGWLDHAHGPFSDTLEAEGAMVEIEPGDPLPEGMTLGFGKCDYPDPPTAAPEDESHE